MPDSAEYHTVEAHRIRGELHLDSLQRAVDQVVSRHSILRTTYREERGLPRAVVYADRQVVVQEIDLTRIGARDEARVAARLREEAGRRFDLTEDLPLRMSALRLGEADWVLLVVIHHIACDAWSLRVLREELSAGYRAAQAGLPARLEPLQWQYADYVRWERDRVTGDETERELDLWQARLANAPPVLDLPLERPRPAALSYRGDVVDVHISAELSQAVRVRAKSERVTSFAVLLAAYAVLLQRHSGQDDLVIGIAVARRHHPWLEPLIGILVDVLPLRFELGDDPTVRQLLGRARDATLAAVASRNVRLEALVDRLVSERSLSHSPLFQAAFTFDNVPLAELSLPGATVTKMPVHGGGARFELTLILHDRPQGIDGTFEFSTDLFDRESVAPYASRLARLVEQIVDAPDRPISQLEVLDAKERARIVDIWNATAVEYPREATIGELFVALARSNPDRVAAEDGRRSLSYRQLDRVSDGVAARLSRHGVRVGDRVALCMHRSLEMLAGMLGVLKAGAAYVPIDPAFPFARRALLVEDAGVDVVLTGEGSGALPAGVATMTVDLECPSLALAGGCDRFTLAGVGATDPAYVMYTSGSAGRPKGVVVTHRAVIRLVRGADYATPRARGDIPLSSASRIRRFDVRDLGQPAQRCSPRGSDLACPGDRRNRRCGVRARGDDALAHIGVVSADGRQ